MKTPKNFASNIKVLIIVLCLTLVISGCTKKSDQEKAADSSKIELASSSLFSKLPAGTVGFSRFKTGGENYDKYKSSPWGNGKVFDSLSNINTAQTGFDFKALEEVFKKVGLISPGTGQPEAIAEGIMFAAGPDKLRLGGYFTGSSGHILKASMVAVREELVRQGIATKDEAIADRFAFSIASKSPAPLDRIYFVADDGASAVSTDIDVAANLFTGAMVGSLQLKQAPYYAKTVQAAARSKGPLMVGYLDMNLLIPLIKDNMAKNDPASAAILNDFPVQAVAFERGYEDSLADTAVISFEAKKDLHKVLLEALSQASSGKGILQSTPGNVLVSLTFDGLALRKIKDSMQAATPPAQETPDDFAMFNDVTRMQIAMRSAGAESPFPEVLVQLESGNGAQLAKLLVGELKTQLAASGLPVGPWQTTKVGTTDVDFTMTPFGVGLYVGSVGNYAVISTSDHGISDSALAASDPAQSLLAKLPKSAQNIFGAQPTLLTAFINFPQLAETVEMVQGNLSMFTGGQPVGDPETIARLKSLGTMMYSARFNDSLLTIEGRFE